MCLQQTLWFQLQLFTLLLPRLRKSFAFLNISNAMSHGVIGLGSRRTKTPVKSFLNPPKNAEKRNFQKNFCWKWECARSLYVWSVGRGGVIDGCRFLINSPPSFSFRSMARLCTWSLVYRAHACARAHACKHACTRPHLHGVCTYIQKVHSH